MWGTRLPGRRIEQQNWAELLLFLYSREEKWESFGRGKPSYIDSDHPLVKRTNLNKSQVKSALSFLEEHNLIRDDGSGFFKLTPRGFEVVHEREMKERELRNHSIIAFLTVILALGALGQILSALQSFDLPVSWLLLPAILVMMIGYSLGKLDQP